MKQLVNIDFVSDTEDVARMLFSPLFICDGILSQKAFTLEDVSNETYISVLRTSISSFETDMVGIRKEGNTVEGYALLNVGEIRHPQISYKEPLGLDVLPRNAGKRKSHAGIFATIGQKRLRGGSPSQLAECCSACIWSTLHRRESSNSIKESSILNTIYPAWQQSPLYI